MKNLLRRTFVAIFANEGTDERKIAGRSILYKKIAYEGFRTCYGGDVQYYTLLNVTYL